jgi:hypothetical protein
MQLFAAHTVNVRTAGPRSSGTLDLGRREMDLLSSSMSLMRLRLRYGPSFSGLTARPVKSSTTYVPCMSSFRALRDLIVDKELMMSRGRVVVEEYSRGYRVVWDKVEGRSEV